MTDAARALIDSALTLMGACEEPFAIHVGGRHWASFSAAPAVFVRYGAISHSPPDSIGGMSPSIYTEAQELILRILGRDEEDARRLKNAILRAFRDKSSTANGVTPGGFRWLTEDEPGYSRDGAALQGSIVVALPVPKFSGAQPTAVVLQTQFTTELTNE